MIITKIRQLDEKRPLKYFGKFQAIIDSDLCKSIRPITRDMGVIEFLRQLVHVDVGCFSYTMRKRQFLSQDRKNKEKRVLRFLTNSSIPSI